MYIHICTCMWVVRLESLEVDLTPFVDVEPCFFWVQILRLPASGAPASWLRLSRKLRCSPGSPNVATLIGLIGTLCLGDPCDSQAVMGGLLGPVLGPIGLGGVSLRGGSYQPCYTPGTDTAGFLPRGSRYLRALAPSPEAFFHVVLSLGPKSSVFMQLSGFLWPG